MFVWSFRMNKRELIIAAAGILIFAALSLILLFRGGAFDREDGAEARTASARAYTADDRAAYLTGFGWKIEETPLSVREVAIPRVFNAEFSEYSKLQSEQGFDFERLRGERVKLYTYRVTNYPAAGVTEAELLIKDGRVVGGDISRKSMGGAVQGLDPALYGGAAAKLQREQAEAAIDRTVPDAIPADTDALPEPDSEGEW